MDEGIKVWARDVHTNLFPIFPIILDNLKAVDVLQLPRMDKNLPKENTHIKQPALHAPAS